MSPRYQRGKKRSAAIQEIIILRSGVETRPAPPSLLTTTLVVAGPATSEPLSRKRRIAEIATNPWSSSSQTSAEDYSRAILVYLRCREQRSPNVYKQQSPQLEKRRHLVDWTCVVAEKLHLGKITAHLAVRIIDFFMDRHDIQELQLYLVCLTSLLISAKFEEKDSKVPKIPALAVFICQQFQVSDFQSLEKLLLSFLGWNLNWPTAAHFVEILRPSAIQPADYLGDRRVGADFGQDRAKFEMFTNYFLDIYLQDETMVPLLPSIVASSILHCSRAAMSFFPEWPRTLMDLCGGHSTGNNVDMEYCCSRLLSVYEKSSTQSHSRSVKRRHNCPTPSYLSPDQGYVTLDISDD